MIIKKGETIPRLEEGRYAIRLARHEGSFVGPIAEAEKVIELAQVRGYYKETALEDMEIAGPFRYLNLVRRD